MKWAYGFASFVAVVFAVGYGMTQVTRGPQQMWGCLFSTPSPPVGQSVFFGCDSSGKLRSTDVVATCGTGTIDLSAGCVLPMVGGL